MKALNFLSSLLITSTGISGIHVLSIFFENSKLIRRNVKYSTVHVDLHTDKQPVTAIYKILKFYVAMFSIWYWLKYNLSVWT